jgi:hypothetical protein
VLVKAVQRKPRVESDAAGRVGRSTDMSNRKMEHTRVKSPTHVIEAPVLLHLVVSCAIERAN